MVYYSESDETLNALLELLIDIFLEQEEEQSDEYSIP